MHTNLRSYRKYMIASTVTLGAAFGLVASAVATDTAGPQSQNAAATARTSVDQARALSSAPQVSIDGAALSPHYSDVSDLRRVGAELAAKIPTPAPLPISVNWEAAAETGGDNRAAMQAVVEFNAACKWYVYSTSTSGSLASGQTIRVLETIPTWPTFRGTFKADWASQLNEAVRSADFDSVRQFIMANC